MFPVVLVADNSFAFVFRDVMKLATGSNGVTKRKAGTVIMVQYFNATKMILEFNSLTKYPN